MTTEQKSSTLICHACGVEFSQNKPGRITPTPDETYCSQYCASEHGWYDTGETTDVDDTPDTVNMILRGNR